MRAVLFDLDGTLLDLDLDAFLARYFVALENASRPLMEVSRHPASFMRALHSAVGAMMEPHSGRTNRDVFFSDLVSSTGIDLTEHWGVYEAFYRDTFPTLGDASRPARGARRAVEAALELGLCVGVATNPIFPRQAVDHRIGWAGLSDIDFGVVTTYEDMEACKPHPAYFRQTAAILGVDPAECIMVGDDRALDMPAADVGMTTFYVGTDPDAVSDYRGDLDALADLLPLLA